MHRLPNQVSAFDFDRRRSTSVTFGLKELLRSCNFNTGTIILTTVRNLANLRRAVRDGWVTGEGGLTWRANETSAAFLGVFLRERT